MADNIMISAHRDNYRRGGIAHYRTPTIYAEGFWSQAHLDLFIADKHLDVVVTTDEPTPGSELTVMVPLPQPVVEPSYAAELFPVLTELAATAPSADVEAALTAIANSSLSDVAVDVADDAADTGQKVPDVPDDPEEPETPTRPRAKRARRRREARDDDD